MAEDGPGVEAGPLEEHLLQEGCRSIRSQAETGHGDSIAEIMPLFLVIVEEAIGIRLLKKSEGDFHPFGSVLVVKNVGIQQTHLKDIEDGLLCPAIHASSNGIVIDQNDQRLLCS